jgi:outer membrane protein OmpA-like peptidoglycan-associated protein
VAAIFVTAAAGFSSSANAQLQNAPVDIEIFRPAMDSKGFVTVNSSAVLGQYDISFGLVTSYARRPLRFTGAGMPFNNQAGVFSVDTLLRPSLQAAIGFLSLPHLGAELGIIIPMGVVAGRSTPSDDGGTPTATLDDREWTFGNQGLGDIQIHPKLRFLNATRRGLGFAIMPSIILGTGDKNSFLGEGKTMFQPMAILDTELGYLGRFRASVNAGMRIRGSSSTYVNNPMSFSTPPTFTVGGVPMGITTGGSIEVKNEVIGGVGLSYGIVPQKFDLVAELYGNYGLDSHRTEYARRHARDHEAVRRGDRRHQALPRPQLVLRDRRRLQGVERLRFGRAARLRRLHLRAVDRRPRRRRLQGRRRSVPGRSGRLRRLRGRGRLPRARQRQGRHPRRRGQVPERARDQERLSGRGRLPGFDHVRSRRRPHPRRRRQVPDDPEDYDNFEDEDGCPDPDNDKDGIKDVEDACPNVPEDKDGFEDQDGCPDPDNDHDRIPDVSDKCPNEPETYNGVNDDDGCPDQGLATMTKGKIVTMKPIYFETDKDIIKPESFPVVDSVAAAINGNPWIEMVEIQGHADERGDDAHNLDLTERRAASVRRALEERNVLPSKLRSHGYGETKPICKEHNENCWSKNRRVEFIIEKTSGQGGAKFQGGEGQ